MVVICAKVSVTLMSSEAEAAGTLMHARAHTTQRQKTPHPRGRDGGMMVAQFTSSDG